MKTVYLLMAIILHISQSMKVNLTSKETQVNPLIKLTHLLGTVKYSTPTFPLCLGKIANLQCFTLGFAFDRTYLYLYSKLNSTKARNQTIKTYNPASSSSFSIASPSFLWGIMNEMVNMRIGNDIPSIVNNTTEPFTFALVTYYNKTPSEAIDGYLSLSKHYYNNSETTNASLSFVKYLHRNHIIKDQSFTFALNPEGDGQLVFGNEEGFSISNETNTCNSSLALSHLVVWECRSTRISIGTEIINEETMIIFDIKEPLIYVPYDEQMLLAVKFMKETKNYCMIQEDEGYYLILCPMDMVDYDKTSDIVISFGEHGKVRLRWRNLFSEGLFINKRVMISRIVFIKGRGGWLLGEPAFRGNLIRFDMEKQVISFPERTTISREDTVDGKEGIVVSCYWFLVVLGIGGIGVLLKVKVLMHNTVRLGNVTK